MIDLDHIMAMIVGALLGAMGLFVALKPAPQPKPCPGEVVSMVIDKDGTVLCTYMLVPQGIKTTKEKQNAK